MKPTIHRFRVSKPGAIPTSTSLETASTHISRNLGTNIPISLQACERCKRLKKKCSKKLPACELCVAAWHACSLKEQADLVVSPQQLQAKIDWLERYIAENVPNSQMQYDVPGSNLSESMQLDLDLSPSYTSTVTHPIIESPDSHSAAPATSSIKFAKAYFRHVHRAYPFLDQDEVLQNVTRLSDSDIGKYDPNSTKLCLVMAIGCTTLERAGKLLPDTSMSFEVPYSDVIGQCISDPSIESLQILTLLALYSLFDAKGVSTWAVVGILTRQAMSMGLARTASERDTLLTRKAELEHRLIWSIFVLDRMVAVSVGQPAGLVEENMNVPQPSITVDEFASPDRVELASLIQLSHHIIQLRQLEQELLSTIYLPNVVEVSKMAAADRKAIVDQLRSKIEHWYSQGCLVSLPEPDNIPIHNTITWLNARYYNLLILLYYPCHFNSQLRHTSGDELLDFIQKYIQYNKVLLGNRQLPLNRITLNRLIPVCAALLYCFGITRPHVFSGRSELIDMTHTLRQFPHTWRAAHKTAAVMEELGDLIVTHERHCATLLAHCRCLENIQFQPATKTWLKVLQKSLSQILSETLGRSSTYLYIDDWDNEQQPDPRSLPKEAGQGLGPPSNLDANSWTTFTDNFELGFL